MDKPKRDNIAEVARFALEHSVKELVGKTVHVVCLVSSDDSDVHEVVFSSDDAIEAFIELATDMLVQGKERLAKEERPVRSKH